MTKKEESLTVAGVELSKSEIADAKKEGALDYVKEGAGRAMAADTGTTSNYEKAAENQAIQVPADFQSTVYAPLLDLSEDELKRRLTDPKAKYPIPQDVARGLLALERSGKNRTGYVKLLIAVVSEMAGRDVKVTEVTTAGPSHTNDTTNITEL